jgi:CsoR family transcriptional regulator, copper-sensing transcriptional repressor
MTKSTGSGGGATPANEKARIRRKPQPRPPELQQDLLFRLNRAEGQLRGLKKMVSENAYCIDLLQQISAARRALEKLAIVLIRDHLQTCVRDAILERDSIDRVEELTRTLDRFLA